VFVVVKVVCRLHADVATAAEVVNWWCSVFEQNAGAFMLLRYVGCCCQLAAFSLRGSVATPAEVVRSSSRTWVRSCR